MTQSLPVMMKPDEIWNKLKENIRRVKTITTNIKFIDISTNIFAWEGQRWAVM